MRGGELAGDTLNKEIAYGNDVTYDESTGIYILVGTTSSKPGNWASDYKSIGARYHYTYFNEIGTCTTAIYISNTELARSRNCGSFDYTTFSNGVTLEETVKKMTIELEHIASATIKMVLED